MHAVCGMNMHFIMPRRPLIDRHFPNSIMETVAGSTLYFNGTKMLYYTSVYDLMILNTQSSDLSMIS